MGYEYTFLFLASLEQYIMRNKIISCLAFSLQLQLSGFAQNKKDHLYQHPL